MQKLKNDLIAALYTNQDLPLEDIYKALEEAKSSITSHFEEAKTACTIYLNQVWVTNEGPYMETISYLYPVSVGDNQVHCLDCIVNTKNRDYIKFQYKNYSFDLFLAITKTATLIDAVARPEEGFPGEKTSVPNVMKNMVGWTNYFKHFSQGVEQ